MPKNLPKGVSVDRDRHKNVRLYFRAPGRSKVRLREEPGSKAFEEEVECARLGVPYIKPGAQPAKVSRKASEGTFEWLLEQYKSRAMSSVSTKVWRASVVVLEEVCNSKHKGSRRGDLPFRGMALRHAMQIRDELRQTPGARNHVVRSLSALFSWAILSGLAETNPTNGIKKLYSGDGFHTWTPEEFRKFEKRHPLGTQARLAFSLAAYTGLRISDVAIIGKQHIKDGWLVLRLAKTTRSSRVTVELPVLPELQRAIDAGPCGDMTFLVSQRKAPFSKVRLTTLMRQWCDEAGLPNCTMHGIRKAAATVAAENGATDDELMAIFGWTTKQQTTLYTRNASRRKLAGNAIEKIIRNEEGTEIVPPLSGNEKKWGKNDRKSLEIKGRLR